MLYSKPESLLFYLFERNKEHFPERNALCAWYNSSLTDVFLLKEEHYNRKHHIEIDHRRNRHDLNRSQKKYTSIEIYLYRN